MSETQRSRKSRTAFRGMPLAGAPLIGGAFARRARGTAQQRKVAGASAASMATAYASGVTSSMETVAQLINQQSTFFQSSIENSRIQNELLEKIITEVKNKDFGIANNTNWINTLLEFGAGMATEWLLSRLVGSRLGMMALRSLGSTLGSGLLAAGVIKGAYSLFGTAPDIKTRAEDIPESNRENKKIRILKNDLLQDYGLKEGQVLTFAELRNIVGNASGGARVPPQEFISADNQASGWLTQMRDAKILEFVNEGQSTGVSIQPSPALPAPTPSQPNTPVAASSQPSAPPSSNQNPAPQSTPTATAPQQPATPDATQAAAPPAATGDVSRVSVSPSGAVNESELYQTLVKRFSSSPLNGFKPQDGDRFGVVNGAPEEWAKLALALGKQESSLNANASNGGLYQFLPADLARYGVQGAVNDPNTQVEAMARQWEKFIIRDGNISGQDASGRWMGAAAYFEPFRYGGGASRRMASGQTQIDKWLGATAPQQQAAQPTPPQPRTGEVLNQQSVTDNQAAQDVIRRITIDAPRMQSPMQAQQQRIAQQQRMARGERSLEEVLLEMVN